MKRPINGAYPSIGNFTVAVHDAPAHITADSDTIVVTTTGLAFLLRAGESYALADGTAYATTSGTRS